MKVRFTIDGREVEAEEGQSILEAALASGIYIPHLCYHPDLPSFKEALPSEVCYRGEESYRSSPDGDGYEGCGLCLVEFAGRGETVVSCITPVEEGLEVISASPQIESSRQEKLQKILATHPHACLLCAQKEGCSLTQCSTNVPEEERCCPQFDFCELRKVSEFIGIKEDMARYVPRHLYVEDKKPLFIRDYNLCVGCLRCVRVCREVVGAGALCYVVEEGGIIVGTKAPTLEESGCRFCGACAEVCPTGAIRDKEIKPGERRESLIPCTASCPVGMDIPAYIRFIAQGKDTEASKVIREKVPLALTLGYICHHPCESGCRRQELNQAVAICALKRFVLEKEDEATEMKREPSTGKRVAVVGSGPSGLVAAYWLAKKGHTVRVFESQPEPGGMLRLAIPEYRLPREIVRREIENIKAMGVEIQTQAPITKEFFLEELNPQRWDAVLLATGAPESRRIDVEGCDSEGIFWGVDFLKQAKEGKQELLEGKVVVIGGGNVALDVALTALRMGASQVELACLEKRQEMPAFEWEISEAEEEGIVLHPGWGPAKIERNGRRIRGITLMACTSVFNDKGEFCPEFDSSQKTFLEADHVILAVGQKIDLSYIPPELGIRTEEGLIKVDPETLRTNVAGIYAAGEVIQGPASAVEAMALGRKAASSIDRYLGGEGLREVSPDKEKLTRSEFWTEEEEGFASRERTSMPCIPMEKRIVSFDLIQEGYSEEQARTEANRCLRCDLRLRLSPAFLPPERWLDFTPEFVSKVPESEGAFQLLDEKKEVIYIAGTPNLRKALEEQLASRPEAKYFTYEEDPMYTKRESELIQQFLQKHGHLPPGNEEVEDLF